MWSSQRVSRPDRYLARPPALCVAASQMNAQREHLASRQLGHHAVAGSRRRRRVLTPTHRARDRGFQRHGGHRVLLRTPSGVGWSVLEVAAQNRDQKVQPCRIGTELTNWQTTG